MKRDDWDRAEKEFNDLFDLEEKDRNQRLGEIKEEDIELYENVKKILDFSINAGSFLKNDIVKSYKELLGSSLLMDQEKNPELMAGRLVGKYKIIKQLGYGGMGAVYLAERADGEYERKVALKFIRAEIGHELLADRFRNEQQIQAMLNHPSIPRLYDTGLDEHGTPFIVMEYVEGEPVTDYFNRNNAGIEAILEIFVKICDTIHFAHQNLVIHRDLKPSNILITKDGDCKLLDFGISKLVSDELNPELTHSALHFFSFKYAAPEQLKNEPVTTATDVYSIGVVLYELVTGLLPYDVEALTLAELEQTICNVPVQKPSSRLLKSAGNSAKEIKRAKSIQGDLDTIILKALEKEPSRRYASVKSLAEDIERYLKHEPIMARAPGLLYTTGKFVRRHAAMVSVAVLLTVLILSGVFYHSNRLTEERNLAQLEAEKFEQIAGFMIDLFEYDDLQVLPAEATIANLLDSGVDRMGESLSDNPIVKAEIMRAIGNSYLKIGEVDRGFEILSDALSTYEEFPETYRTEYLETVYDVTHAAVLSEHPEQFEMIDFAREKIGSEWGEYSDEYAQTLWLEARALQFANQGVVSEMEEIMDRYLEIMSTIYPEDAPEYGQAVFEHAIRRHDRSERLEALSRALEVNRQIQPVDSMRIANILNSLGFQSRTVDAEQSIEYYHEALDIYLDKIGAAHHRSITTLTNLGASLRRAGRHEEAIETFTRSMNAAREVFRPGSIHISDQQFWLANAQLTISDLDNAEQNFGEVLVVFESNYEPGNQKLELARILYGEVIKRNGRTEVGRAHLQQAIENVTSLYGENHNLISMANARM